MAACHRLTSQICVYNKAISCWFTVMSFLEIIYRTVDLHTLSSCSLLSPAICLAIRVGLQNAKYLSEHAEEHWSHIFPESRVSKANSGHQKIPTRDWGGGKGIWHPISAVKEEMSYTWWDHHFTLTGTDGPQGLHWAQGPRISHCIEIVRSAVQEQADWCGCRLLGNVPSGHFAGRVFPSRALWFM